jgi:hypothetical protein
VAKTLKTLAFAKLNSFVNKNRKMKYKGEDGNFKYNAN